MKSVRLLILYSILAFAGGVKAQISVMGRVEHVTDDGIDTTGDITLAPSGGTAPYTYVWKKGGITQATTKDLSAATKGHYSATVTDAASASKAHAYNIGYKTAWTHLNGIVPRNDSLISIEDHIGYNPTARSVNVLKPNTDGWFEFVLQQTNDLFVMGFVDKNEPEVAGGNSDMDFAVHTTSGYIYAFSNNIYTWLDYIHPGDVIRVQRTGSAYQIFLNDVLLYNAEANASKALKIKSIIFNPMVNLGASFSDPASGPPLSINTVINHINPDGIQTKGSIDLNPKGGATPYAVSITPASENNSSNNLNSLSKDLYNIRLTDGNGDSIKRLYNVGYRAKWTNENSLVVTKDSILAIASDPPVAVPSCISKNILNAGEDGWAELIVEPYSAPFLIGFFDAAVSTPALADINFAMHLTTGNSFYVYTNGNFTLLGYAQPGDVIRMIRTTTDFILYKNDVEVYTAAILISKSLKLKTFIEGSIAFRSFGCSFQPGFNASVTKTHADFSHPDNGTASIFPYGIKGPYTVRWPDGAVMNSRSELIPRRYTVTISDSARTDSIYKTIDIGIKPSWKYKSNIDFSGDTIFQAHADSIGVSVAENIINASEQGGFEITINDPDKEMAIGFIASGSALPDSKARTDFFAAEARTAKNIIKKSDDNTLNYIDGVLRLDDGYANIISIKKGKISVLLNGSPQNTDFYYEKGDVIKMARNEDNKITVVKNDKVVYQDATVIDSYLYPVNIVKGGGAAVIVTSLAIIPSPALCPYSMVVQSNSDFNNYCPGSSISFNAIIQLNGATLSPTSNFTWTSVPNQAAAVVSGPMNANYLLSSATNTFQLSVSNSYGGCPYTKTVQINIIGTMPTIQYAPVAPLYAPVSLTLPVTQTGPTPGVYSILPAASGITINSATGEIHASGSPFNTYTVTYSHTPPGGGVCTAPYVATTTVDISNLACDISIENNIPLCPGDKMQVIALALGVNDFSWSPPGPSNIISCANCGSPIITYTNSITQYTVTGYKAGVACGTKVLTLVLKTDCEKEEIIGCCFSNYGAAVWVSDSTYLNIYCNLLNEVGFTSTVSTNIGLQKGEFQVEHGYVRVLLDWIHNAQNTLYTTHQGTTSVFGANQKIKGNSSTAFNELWLEGSGTKSLWINAFAYANLNLNNNVLSIQDFTFAMKNRSAEVIRSTGYASTGMRGYFSWLMGNAAEVFNQKYLFPLGGTASSSQPFRYRPLVMGNNSTTGRDEISGNFMNIGPMASGDPALVNFSTLQAPNVLQINNAFFHKVRQSVPTTTASNIYLKSYYLPADGQFQSIAEWEMNPAQLIEWWGATPGSSASNTISTDAGTQGMIYAMANGTLNFNREAFTLSRGGFYLNTNAFGGNGTMITLTATPSGAGSATPAGGGINNPYGTGPNSGNSGTGGNTVFSPSPVAGEYIMTVTPPNDCAIPGKVRFIIDQNGNIAPSDVKYGLAGASGFSGDLSESVYSIDNINSGITFNATPKNLLKNCVNSVTVTTSAGVDFVLDPTTSETIDIYLPAPTTGNTINYGYFNLYYNSFLVYSTTNLNTGLNQLTVPGTLAQGAYRFELQVTASAAPPITEILKGQIIIKH